MIDSKISKLKGFMPKHEGTALTKWSKEFSSIGPIMEIGSYCGKSAMYLSKGAILNDQLVYTIDHHFGSEEHQINEEYFDGGHSFKAANDDYESWNIKIKQNGALVIHDIFENPNEGGQAPFEIFKKALKNNFEIYERVDTLACLKKK